MHQECLGPLDLRGVIHEMDHAYEGQLLLTFLFVFLVALV